MNKNQDQYKIENKTNDLDYGLAMGAFLSAREEANGNGSAAGGAPKSFYLVLGGPSIRYSRPGRGPLIFDVEPMCTNTEDLVEHAEVVRPTANISSKQRFQLIPTTPPNPTGYPSTTQWTFRLRFNLEYSAPPQRVEVFIDTQIEYRTGEGIMLLPRSSGASATAAVQGGSSVSMSGRSAAELSRQGTSVPSQQHDPSRGEPTRVLFKNSFPARSTTEAASTVTLDMTSFCTEFSLSGLVPALPKDQLTNPCSLKECPIVIVSQFEVAPAQAARRAPAHSQGNAAQGAMPADGGDSSSVPEVTAVHRLFTFLTFDEKQLESLYGKKSGKVHHPPTQHTVGGGAQRHPPTSEASAADNDIELSELRHIDATLVKQYLEFSGEVYELDDIYDLGGDDLGAPPAGATGDPGVSPRAGEGDVAVDVEVDNDDGDDMNNCVICLCNPKDTTVIPCRHLCLCAECAVQLRHQSNKCPICRRPIERLMTM